MVIVMRFQLLYDKFIINSNTNPLVFILPKILC